MKKVKSANFDKPNNHIKPLLVGGIGEKKSNGGSQYYQQNRIYDSGAIAVALPASLPGGSYLYVVYEKKISDSCQPGTKSR